jgi:hypothetical protein
VKMEGFGVEVDVPQGWDGEIYRRADVPDHAAGAVALPVVHLANFPLPGDQGDYGSGAVERMGPGNILVVLAEFEPEAVDTALFSATGIPTVRAEDFGPDRLQRTIPGQSGVQYFFNHQGRAFCLYVVLGSMDVATNWFPR